MDFAQTFFDCCGINDSINYDTSLWRLQKFGREDLSVPLTCCKLMNKFDENSFLDPQPVNSTLCQSLQPQDFQKSRHLDGCLDKIENFHREHFIFLLYGGLALSTLEFFLLLAVILSCTKIKKKKAQKSQMNFLSEMQTSGDFIAIGPPTREIFIQPLGENLREKGWRKNCYRINSSLMVWKKIILIKVFKVWIFFFFFNLSDI